MKKILISISFLISLCLLTKAQITTYPIAAGQWAIFDNAGNTATTVKYYPEASNPAYKYGITVVDTVFYVPETASLDTISTFTRPTGQTAAFLLERGGRFSGELPITGDSIFIGHYGTGAIPVLYGSEAIAGWTNYSGNIWRTSYTENVMQLSANNTRLTLARTPNVGQLYHNITTVNSTTEFISTDLDSETSDYFQNATAHIQTNLWVLQTANVASSTGNTITLSSGTGYAIALGDKFFLNNKLAFLDEAGEWYNDTINNYIYVWMPDGSDPNNSEVRASITDNALYLDNQEYITVDGIEFREYASNTIGSPRSNHITIKNCTIADGGGSGIEFYDQAYFSHHNTFTNNTISGVMNCGIRARTYYSDISHNNISDVAEFSGIGSAGIGLGTGISIDGDYQDNGFNTITYNRLERIGYNGISWRGQQTLIQYNFIYKPCNVLTDGAAIYTFTASDDTTGIVAQGSQVLDNLVVDANGFFDEYNNKYGCHILYLDESSEGVTVKRLYGFGGGYSGIYLHEAVQNVIDSCYLYDSPIGILANGQYADNSITNTTIICSSRTGVTAWWSSGGPQRLVWQANGSDATFDNNEYISPYNKRVSFYLNSDNSVNFDEWKTATSQDANSTCEYFSVGRAKERIFYNDSTAQKSITLAADTTFFDYYGNTVSSPLVLEPFTGVVLLAEIPTQLEDNLVAYWKLDETTGTTLNDSWTNNLDGTIINLPTLGVTGKVGTAFTLASTSTQRMEIADNNLLTLTNNFSYSFTINQSSTVAAYKPLLYKNREIHISVYNGYVYVDIYTGGTTTYGRAATSSAIITPETWHTVMVTCDSTATVTRQSLHIYVDGDEQGLSFTQNSGTINITNGTYDYVLGRQSTNGYYWDGSFDEHKVWDRKLTRKQVAEDYHNVMEGEVFTDY